MLTRRLSDEQDRLRISQPRLKPAFVIAPLNRVGMEGHRANFGIIGPLEKQARIVRAGRAQMQRFFARIARTTRDAPCPSTSVLAVRENCAR